MYLFEASGHGKVIKEMLIYLSAIISPSVIIGEGTVDHDCVIEDFCHIALGAHVSGATHVGDGTWIGVVSSVIQCLKIGRNCMIGAGSVVVRDIPDNATAYGNPCKVKKYNNINNVLITILLLGGRTFFSSLWHCTVHRFSTV